MATSNDQTSRRRAAKSRAYQRRDAWKRLEQFLQRGQGHACVVGEDTYALSRQVLRAASHVRGMRVLHISARFERLNVLAELLQASVPAIPDAATLEKSDTAALFGEIAAARSGGFPMLILIEDCDLASPSSLETARAAAEAFASPTMPVRMVLLGGTFLDRMLEMPSVAALNSRISQRFSF